MLYATRLALSENDSMNLHASHEPTDRNKALWKRVALLALIAVWLGSGIVGRDAWKPDEPIYLGILHSMLTVGGDAWWSPEIGGMLAEAELPFIHWINAAIAFLPHQFLPLHEAARFSSIAWIALSIFAVALAARQWSAGHISYLAAVIFIGCLGLYDRAHAYLTENSIVAAIALVLYGASQLADFRNRATMIFVAAGVLAFASHGTLGALLVSLPLVLFAFAPVLSMHRVALLRSVAFIVVVCIVLTGVFASRAPDAFQLWVESGAGLVLSDRDNIAPQNYVIALLWFSWPAWPLALWTITLRVRGFAGGWARAEILAPSIVIVSSFCLLNAFAEPRTVQALFFLPPLVLLAAFGVDTVRRSWYALIDWFGILVLGLAGLAALVVSFAVYFKWPTGLAIWISRFIPGFEGSTPWFGYATAAIAYVAWIALVQPAHQHSRRALINWAGCVTLVWVVAQALLLKPADYVTSHRASFQSLAGAWPIDGCVSAVAMPASETALLHYYAEKTVVAAPSVAESDCDAVLIQRWRGAPPAPEPDQFNLRARAVRPGNSSESFELYTRVVRASEKQRPEMKL